MTPAIQRTREAQERVDQLVSQRRCLVCEEPTLGGSACGECTACYSYLRDLIASGEVREEDLLENGFRLLPGEVYEIRRNSSADAPHTEIEPSLAGEESAYPDTVKGRAQCKVDGGYCLYCGDHTDERLWDGHCSECADFVQSEVKAGRMTIERLVSSGLMLLECDRGKSRIVGPNSGGYAKRLALKKMFTCDAQQRAIPPSAVTPGRWLLRWVDGRNEEHIRKVVVTELNGVSRWVQFVDANWQPQSDSSAMLVSYLGDNCGFLPAGSGESGDE